MGGSGEENNNGSGCGDKNRMRAVEGKQEIYLEWPTGDHLGVQNLLGL